MSSPKYTTVAAMSAEKPEAIKPRIIIHGGAGHITKQNLSEESYQAHRDAMLQILREAAELLEKPGAAAIDVATHAVSLLENNALFNAGHGAVFTRGETIELEASVMVSRGYRKRGVGVMNVTRVRNPIFLAKEMLIRGQADDGDGAGPHCQLQGAICDRLAERWGLETVQPSYFWTKQRWQEHRKALGLDISDEIYEAHKRQADERAPESSVTTRDVVQTECSPPHPNITYDQHDYLPQGTVGAVVLDSTGTVCAATSTGGITNKVQGRIGDTPTLGAGFWAEEWEGRHLQPSHTDAPTLSMSGLAALMSDCLPGLSGYLPIPNAPSQQGTGKIVSTRRAVGMSGTGNGDSFLRINAVRTAAAMARFSRLSPLNTGMLPLQQTVTAVAGPNGALQQSAEDRWRKTGEGEGGIIGIDLRDGQGYVVADFNCGGMFRAWIDDGDQPRMAVFREEGR